MVIWRGKLNNVIHDLQDIYVVTGHLARYFQTWPQKNEALSLSMKFISMHLQNNCHNSILYWRNLHYYLYDRSMQ